MVLLREEVEDAAREEEEWDDEQSWYRRVECTDEHDGWDPHCTASNFGQRV